MSEVRRSARRVARRYPAEKYSIVGNWRDGLDDLVGDVLADVFVRDAQLGWFAAEASSLDEFRQMLDWHTRRVLARHRRTTVVDNLILRSRRVLTGPGWATETRSGSVAFRRADAVVEVRAASAGEVFAAARAVRRVPYVEPSARAERAPIVYHQGQLVAVLELVAASLPCVFTFGELDRIFELALTRFLPSVLDVRGLGDPGLLTDPDVLRAAQRVVSTLADPQRVVLAGKLDRVPDQVIADHMGVSRPTVALHKQAAFDVLRQVLEPLDGDARLAAMDLVAAAVAHVAPPKPALLGPASQ